MRGFAEHCVPADPVTPPWHLLPWLLLLAFVLRAAVALSGDYIVHPDEIMQYLEPAHGLVFGNSVSYWEYYYGARSWLVPYAIAAVLFLCKVLGLGEAVYYIPIVKLVLCAFSLLIPLCLYHLGRRLFGEESGRAALLLGVFWYELVGFAHKPMTEFVATALFLVLMGRVLRPHLTPTQAAVVSAFAVFVVAVRFQYAPLVGALWLLAFVRGSDRNRALMLAAAAAMVVAVGIFDRLTWGEFLQPYRVNYHYNAALAAHRGDTPGNYIVWLLIASGGLLAPALAATIQGNRQAMLLLLLMLAIFVPHEMQGHREYRFVFALTPLWLLLCAHCIRNGLRWAQAGGVSESAHRWRRVCLWGWALLASAAGIANALPWQDEPYANERASTNYPYLSNFLRDRDELFPLYRELAADDSVRGVKDNRRYYSNTGGYYYIHHKVPFYDVSVPLPADKMKEYVSHIIALPPTQTKGETMLYEGELMLIVEDNILYPLPGYVSDATRNKLVYYNKSGKATVVEGFTLASSGKQFALWKAEQPAAVRPWKSYRIYLGNAEHYNLLARSMGKVSKPPLERHSIEFADAPAAE